MFGNVGVNIIVYRLYSSCCNNVQVQHALKKSDKALSTLDRAIAIDPRNPLCKFHRASVLFASDKHKACIWHTSFQLAVMHNITCELLFTYVIIVI